VPACGSSLTHFLDLKKKFVCSIRRNQRPPFFLVSFFPSCIVLAYENFLFFFRYGTDSELRFPPTPRLADCFFSCCCLALFCGTKVQSVFPLEGLFPPQATLPFPFLGLWLFWSCGGKTILFLKFVFIPNHAGTRSLLLFRLFQAPNSATPQRPARPCVQFTRLAFS